MVRTLRSVVAVAVIALAVTACGGAQTQSTGTAKTPYRVLTVLGVTGPQSAAANAELAAIKAAANVINGKGGMLDRKIEIEQIDDGGDPTKATSLLVDRLTNGTAPDLVVPGTSSNEALAMAPTLTRQKILSIGQASSTKLNDPATYPYTFELSGIRTLEPGLVGSQLTQKGYKKVGIFAGNDAYGQSWTPQFESGFKSAGLTTAVVQFNPSAVDLSAQLSQLQAQNPDVVYWDAFGASAGYILKAFQKLGWAVPQYAGLGTAANDLVTLAGTADAVKALHLLVYKIQVYVAPTQRSKQLTEMLSAIGTTGAKIDEPINVYSAAYDFLQVISTAVKQANATDLTKVVAALENMKQPNPVPWLTYPAVPYTSTNHFVKIGPDAYTFTSAGPLVDGMIKPAA